jgi:HK97 family phage major capsid protein
MMKSSIQIRNELKECVVKAEAIDEVVKQESRELTADETSSLASIHAEVENLNKALDTSIKYEAIVASKMAGKLAERTGEGKPEAKDIPVRFKSQFRKGVFSNALDAYNSGQFILATIYGNKKSKEYCRENGIPMRVQNAMTTGDNTKGGFLVPEPLEAAIIELREQFGVFSREAQPWTMSESVQNVPKLAGEVTTYYVGENTAITPSDMALNLVRLEARKLAALTAVSSELNEDSVISVAEALARSVAQAFANQEDQAGFNGDGTSTYGGIVGLKSALAAGAIHDALSGNVGFSTLDLADFETAAGKLKMYGGIMPKWYISQAGWANSMQRLLDAVGGNNGTDVANGMPMRFLGYPVVISQVLPTALTSTTSTILAYFGDLRMGAIFGRRRGLSIQADSSFYFNQDAIAIRATQRFDINVHERGTASEAGAIVALKTAAS